MKGKGFDNLGELRDQVRDVTAALSKHTELEAAIEEHPDDVTTYSVYADALERAG